MRFIRIVFLAIALSTFANGALQAERPTEKREQADYVLSGKVTAVYKHESEGYREFIVEIKISQVTKGDGIKKGHTFRAMCYQRKENKGGLEFDTAGHSVVPKEGQQITVFVNRADGRNEGVYPNWVDIAAKN